MLNPDVREPAHRALYCSSEDTNDSVSKKVSKTYLWNQEFKWVRLCTPTVQQSGKMIASSFCSQGGEGLVSVSPPLSLEAASCCLNCQTSTLENPIFIYGNIHPITHFAQFSSLPVPSPTFLPPIFSPTFPPIFIPTIPN